MTEETVFCSQGNKELAMKFIEIKDLVFCSNHCLARAALGPGVHVATLSGWSGDTLAGPVFRLVNTIIIPDQAADTIVELGSLAPSTEARRYIPADSARPFEIRVGSMAAGEQALAFLHEPGGAPWRAGHGVVAGHGDDAAVFNVDGAFYAIANTCVHRGGRLGEGDVVGDVVACPWHNWEFNVKTGACINNPSAKVTAYEVTVEGTDIKVRL